MKLFTKIFAGILVVLYPLAIYFGLNYFEPRYLAFFLLAVLVIRFIAGGNIGGVQSTTQNKIIVLLGGAIVIFAISSNSFVALKLYPVLVNFSLLFIFAFSLYNPPSVIERIARLKDPELSENGVAYTRKVTKIWLVFFLVNGSISLFTAYYSTINVWTLYNGLISYVLMGALFTGEFVYRKFFLIKS